MTQISDDRLETDEHDIQEMLTSLDVCQKLKLVLSDEETKWITAGLRELLSAREAIRRLVENSKALAKSLESEYYDCDNEPCALAYHRELLAELEGNKFETAMKRVLDENAGAWKALADGDKREA